MRLRRPVRQPCHPRHTRGMSLLEVMIAVLVLAIGLLGVAALQATALRNSQGSMARSQAVIESYAILDAIRAAVPAEAVNDAPLKATATTAYTLARTCATPAAGATLASNDLSLWIATMQTTLGPGSCGTITCAANICTVTVDWSEQRITGVATPYSITTVAQI